MLSSLQPYLSRLNSSLSPVFNPLFFPSTSSCFVCPPPQLTDVSASIADELVRRSFDILRNEMTKIRAAADYVKKCTNTIISVIEALAQPISPALYAAMTWQTASSSSTAGVVGGRARLNSRGGADLISTHNNDSSTSNSSSINNSHVTVMSYKVAPDALFTSLLVCVDLLNTIDALKDSKPAIVRDFNLYRRYVAFRGSVMEVSHPHVTASCLLRLAKPSMLQKTLASFF